MIIGICDDDKLWCRRAEHLIQEYANKIQTEMEVINFYSVTRLTEYAGEPLDIIFMETIFKDKKDDEHRRDGIWLGRFVNEKWKNCQIVYLTNSMDYVTDVYCTDHLFFVLKDHFAKWISNIFDKAFHCLEQYKEKYLFEAIGGKHFSVRTEDIWYFERSGRVTKVVTTWGTYEIWDKINDIYERISKMDFLRCHNSYIIYYPVIREIVYEKITLENGRVIPISRSYRKKVRQEFARWAVLQRKTG